MGGSTRSSNRSSCHGFPRPRALLGCAGQRLLPNIPSRGGCAGRRLLPDIPNLCLCVLYVLLLLVFLVTVHATVVSPKLPHCSQSWGSKQAPGGDKTLEDTAFAATTSLVIRRNRGRLLRPPPGDPQQTKHSIKHPTS